MRYIKYIYDNRCRISRLRLENNNKHQIMYITKESREKLCIEICNFRDMLMEEFDEELVHTSLLWISALMYFSSSNNLMNSKKESIRAIKAAYAEELERRNKETLLKVKASIQTQKELIDNTCEVLNIADFKKDISKLN